MHELGVVFHIIDDLKEVAVSNEITEITKVVLELGEVSTVIDSYLTDCIYEKSRCAYIIRCT